jgi:hypothetical protein
MGWFNFFSTNTSSLNFTAGDSAGTVSIFVNATLNGVTVEGSTKITITRPALVSVALNPKSGQVQAESSLSFSVTATCSPGPCPSGITYAWALNNTLGSVNTSNGQSTTFTAGSHSGKVTLMVTATLNGRFVTSTAAITIEPSYLPPPPKTFIFGLPGTQGYAVLGGILAAVAIAGIGIALLLGRPSSDEGEGVDSLLSFQENSVQKPEGLYPPKPPLVPPSSPQVVEPPKLET